MNTSPTRKIFVKITLLYLASQLGEKITFWIVYCCSNIVGLLFLVAAIKKTKLARLMFLLLFAGAGVFNYWTSHQQPEVYLMYANGSISVYTQFINGWFKNHITAVVSGIAIGQGLIALGMLLKGNWVNLACIGVMAFLLGMAPFGLNSAFPFSLIVGAAAYFILRNDDKDYLWR